MNFHIGSIHVHKLNGPGFLMATVWLVLQFVCFFCFYDRVSLTPSNVPLTNDHRSKQDEPHSHQQERISMKTYRDQYLRTEMFVLFLATFITYFNQTALETIVAAFTEKHFNWTSVHTSILFAFAGLEIIVVYLLLVKVFSKRFKDRTVLIIGFISLTLACILGTFFTWASYSFGWSTRSAQGLVDKRLLAMFIVFVILDLMGLPFIAATSVSLFTKLTRKELQGFSQGVQRFVMGIGTIGKRIICFLFIVERKKNKQTFLRSIFSWTFVRFVTSNSTSHYDDDNARLNSLDFNRNFHCY